LRERKFAHAHFSAKVSAMTTNDAGGLRERKKVATRDALSAAALRLALERGPENVRVDDIADAAGVSPRTYNNYFASREQAIVAAVTTERAVRIAAALRARPREEPLADAVIETMAEQYGGEPAVDAFTLITSSPRLRAAFIDTVASIRQPLTSAIADRLKDHETMTPAVLAAVISAAARVALEHWARPSDEGALGEKNFVVVTGERSLPDLMRAALSPLAPALAAAEERR
jgi:AcrR family transcriptional regulator